jgi:hypothetical protein
VQRRRLGHVALPVACAIWCMRSGAADRRWPGAAAPLGRAALAATRQARHAPVAQSIAGDIAGDLARRQQLGRVALPATFARCCMRRVAAFCFR